MENKPIHIGEIIRNTMQEQGRSATWLAKQLNCTRDNIYKMYAREWIQTDTLFRVAEILDTDLFAIYSATLLNKKK